MNPKSEVAYNQSVQDRAVEYLVSILPELSVANVSELLTGEITIDVSCPSAALGIGWGTAGVNGDWGSVVVSIGWVSAAVNNCCVKKKI